MNIAGDVIDLVRVRRFTTLAHVRTELHQRELALGPEYTCLYIADETMFWHHDFHGVASYSFSRGEGQGPRGERIKAVYAWRDFLRAAESDPVLRLLGGAEIFIAAHGDNCLHPSQSRSWSAKNWASYAHALRRLDQKERTRRDQQQPPNHRP